MKLIRFEPVDTLFFRDGRPYHQGENTQTNVLSRFPPSPTTMVGAIRAAWARAMGWPGFGSWDCETRVALGGDESELGNGIRFRGPLLIDSERGPIFPVPASVLGQQPKLNPQSDSELPAQLGDPGSEPELPRHLALLAPGDKFDCDLGAQIRLPAVRSQNGGEGRKTLDEWWIDRAGLARVLAGRTPTPRQLVKHNALWRIEARMAIERNHDKRTTEQGALYSPLHVRLHHGVSLGVLCEGLPEGQGQINGVTASAQALGGESRSSWIRVEASSTEQLFPASPELAADGDGLRYSVYVATPMAVTAAPRPGNQVTGLPGTVVSACLPRPQLWGGWNSVQREPQPLRAHIAPGSVFFMQADKADQTAIESLHGQTIGPWASWGFGLVFVGVW